MFGYDMILSKPNICFVCLQKGFFMNTDTFTSLSKSKPDSPHDTAELSVCGSITKDSMTLDEKLAILTDAAKYDVACTSSGVDRKGSGKGIGNSQACGICHTFAADGRCVSLLKILMTNECIFDCKYCINRRSNDVLRATFSPDEICTLTMEFYRRNYIEGLFLSSGILQSPDHTMELFYETLYKLRHTYHFHGYIHIKAIPGGNPFLLEQIGYLCDRMSINLELPTADSLKALAPHKTRKNILTPMKQIQIGIRNSRQNLRLNGKYDHVSMSGSYYDRITQDPPTAFIGADSGKDLFASSQTSSHRSVTPDSNPAFPAASGWSLSAAEETSLSESAAFGTARKYFVPAGQSTQMIVGATSENDYQLLTITENLYKQFELKRVFFSAFIPVNDDPALPARDTKPPLLREHRLYQADWLLRFYGFGASELLSPMRPNFNLQLDPKCDWAVRHLEKFPVEIMKADYYELLRVPGIGVRSARRIVASRKMGQLTFPDLKKFGVVLKRAQFFITCNGHMLYRIPFDERFITNQLIYGEKPFLDSQGLQFTQPTLFDLGLS